MSNKLSIGLIHKDTAKRNVMQMPSNEWLTLRIAPKSSLQSRLGGFLRICFIVHKCFFNHKVYEIKTINPAKIPDTASNSNGVPIANM